MITLKVKENEYKLKFGYKSFKNSGVLKEVVSMEKRIKGTDDNSDDGSENLDLLEEIFDLNSKLVLAALQKYHEEFRTDYSNPDAVKANVDKVDDLLDAYTDEKNAMSIIDMFHALTNELFDNGFLSTKSEKLETALTEQDATVVPIDHRQKEN